MGVEKNKMRGAINAAADKKKKTESNTTTAPKVNPPLTDKQRAYFERNQTEFADASGELNAANDPDNMASSLKGINNAIIKTGFNTPGNNDQNAKSYGAYRLQENYNPTDIEHTSREFKVINDLIGHSLMKARRDQIGDTDTFNRKFDEYEKEALGVDYDKYKMGGFLENAKKSARKLYFDKLQNHKRAEDKYDYDPIAKKLVKKGMVGPNQPESFAAAAPATNEATPIAMQTAQPAQTQAAATKPPVRVRVTN